MSKALVKARMDAMSKHGYGRVYDILGHIDHESKSDVAAALLLLAEKLIETQSECNELKEALRPKREMRRIRSDV